MTDSFSIKKEDSSEVPVRTTKKMVLFNLYIITFGLLWTMWNRIQFFAVTVLLIPQIMIALVFLIYSIVDSVNDPVIGYLNDRSKRFTRKYGKRFPWIIIGTISAPIFLILCFIPIANINVDASGKVMNLEAVIVATIWLIIVMCIYETFLTTAEVNRNALIPDLFRGEGQRRKFSIIGMIIGAINALIAAILIPLLLVSFGGITKISAYITTIIVVVFIFYILTIPNIIGTREPDDMKTFRANLDDTGRSSSPLKEVLVRVFKDNNWMAFTFAYFFYAIGGICVLAGIDFFIVHYLDLGYEAVIFPLLMVLIGNIAAIPIFNTLVKKLGSKYSYLISLIWMAIFYILFFFVEDITGVIITSFIGGIGLGGQNLCYIIVSSEAIDNSVIESGKREEGTYNGILRIFSAFAYFFQALIFAIVAGFTGYIPARGANQTELARLGLKLQMSLIPLAIIIIGIIIFIIKYDISKEDAMANKIKLLRMGL